MQNIQTCTQKRKPQFYWHGVKPSKAKPAYPSEKSQWAYWMQAIEPTDPAINEAFPGFHPIWVQESQRLHVTGEQFQYFRKYLLAISQKQCAAYLRVKPHRVQAWEQGRQPVPFMAFELLRLVYEGATFKLSHPDWDGWFIDRRSGKLVSPDRGDLSFSPFELSYICETYASKANAEAENERLRMEIATLKAELDELRDLYQSGGATEQLHDIKSQLETMLASIGEATSKIYQFPILNQTRKAAA